MNDNTTPLVVANGAGDGLVIWRLPSWRRTRADPRERRVGSAS